MQDIALLRAAGLDVISTNRGYILNEPVAASRVLRVCHTDEQLEEELCTVVDLGGCVKNVIVHHRIYGELEAELNIRSRRDVKISGGLKKRKVQSAEEYYFQLS